MCVEFLGLGERASSQCATDAEHCVDACSRVVTICQEGVSHQHSERFERGTFFEKKMVKDHKGRKSVGFPEMIKYLVDDML